MGDSVDLVPIGAWWGKGKRTGVFGAYLLAAYDEDSEEFQTVCKVTSPAFSRLSAPRNPLIASSSTAQAGTGFSDAVLEQHTDFKEHTIEAPKFNYNFSSAL